MSWDAERKKVSRATKTLMPRICLAASGGGHVRQLMDLEPVWSSYDHFFVTEDSPLSRTISKQHRVHFVPHFAVGQARLGKPFRMALAALRNLWMSAAIILRERPDVIITTGAGAAFFALVWARLLGAKAIVIESFARFETPSIFFRVASPLAHHTVVQATALNAFYPHAAVFDPLQVLDVPGQLKEELVFVTVGTVLTFDRLVEMVGRLRTAGAIPENLLVQTGRGGLRLPGVETVDTLTFEDMQEVLAKAKIVICHGGSGSLITALRQGCHVISVPRLVEHNESYDDHQTEILDAFDKRGLIALVNSDDELAAALIKVRGQAPVTATTNPTDLIRHLRALIEPGVSAPQNDSQPVDERGKARRPVAAARK